MFDFLSMEQALGFSLDDFSFAEAQQMFCEHERAAWQHTSFIVSYLLEINRDRNKGTSITPLDLNPWESGDAPKPGIKLTGENRHHLKALATNAKNPTV